MLWNRLLLTFLCGDVLGGKTPCFSKPFSVLFRECCPNTHGDETQFGDREEQTEVVCEQDAVAETNKDKEHTSLKERYGLPTIYENSVLKEQKQKELFPGIHVGRGRERDWMEAQRRRNTNRANRMNLLRVTIPERRERDTQQGWSTIWRVQRKCFVSV
ncbi:MAG: uncharacterized protein A8A55_1470 [Amphiamblys sp. WSBS2006]|nr:MAG: uncharacterized protein A8A55_1470 [Amphiamblys sp. WSBS2006]